MKISVIICTYNRCQQLAAGLDSLAASMLPACINWEVLVVDNNSTDKTRELVEACCGKHPGRFRYILETEQGKSHALNAGVRTAHGDILAFTDDDVIVEPTWLFNLTAPLQNCAWSGTAGRTLPQRGISLPKWVSLSGSGLAPLGIFDRGSVAGEIAETPFGNNMAFRREMFDKHGLFRLDLGPRPGSAIRSEDTEFGQRLLSAGERVWYEPSAIVYHDVPECRLRKAYFRRWWIAKGQADIRESGAPRDTRWRVAGIPLASFRRMIVWLLRSAIDLRASRRFASETKVWWLAGSIQEYVRQSRTPH
jgi:glucosyl-dolichyl phosphate glucuronosyltransferase